MIIHKGEFRRRAYFDHSLSLSSYSFRSYCWASSYGLCAVPLPPGIHLTKCLCNCMNAATKHGASSLSISLSLSLSYAIHMLMLGDNQLFITVPSVATDAVNLWTHTQYSSFVNRFCSCTPSIRYIKSEQFVERFMDFVWRFDWFFVFVKCVFIFNCLIALNLNMLREREIGATFSLLNHWHVAWNVKPHCCGIPPQGTHTQTHTRDSVARAVPIKPTAHVFFSLSLFFACTQIVSRAHVERIYFIRNCSETNTAIKWIFLLLDCWLLYVVPTWRIHSFEFVVFFSVVFGFSNWHAHALLHFYISNHMWNVININKQRHHQHHHYHQRQWCIVRITYIYAVCVSVHQCTVPCTTVGVEQNTVCYKISVEKHVTQTLSFTRSADTENFWSHTIRPLTPDGAKHGHMHCVPSVYTTAPYSAAYLLTKSNKSNLMGSKCTRAGFICFIQKLVHDFRLIFLWWRQN